MILTSILRTVVPALWGSVIAWLLGIVPALAPLQGQLLGLADFIVPVVTAVIIGAWYALWRWLEPRLPGWLTRALLGSAKTPVYQNKTITGPQTDAVNITGSIYGRPEDRVPPSAGSDAE